MNWQDWQIYIIAVIVVMTLGIYIRRLVKKSEANCCGGRCGCAVSRRKKKLRRAAEARESAE